MTTKSSSLKDNRATTNAVNGSETGIRRDIFLNHRQKNLAVDTAVNKAIHEDLGLDEIPDLDDNLLVLNLKENLYYRITEGSDIHLSQNIDNIIRFLIGFERDLRNEVNRYAYYHSDPKIKTKVFGADDIYPLLEKCFIRASVGDRRIDLDVFDAIAQRYEELSPELTMQLELMHSLAEMAHEWLVQRGFVQKRFEWSTNVLKVKIVLLGPSQAGKTSLLNKYFRPKYAETGIPSTVGISDFITKVVLPNGTECSVIVYDTAGQERFESISKQYCRGAHGVMLVYDHRVEKYEVPNEFESLEDFMFQKYILHNFTATELKTIPVTFFANKSDLWTMKQQGQLPNANRKQQLLSSKSVNFSSSTNSDSVGTHTDATESKQRFHRHSYGTADSASFSLSLLSAAIWQRDFYQIPNIATHWKKVVNPTGNNRCHWVDVLAKGRQAEGLQAEGRQRLLIDSSPKVLNISAESTALPVNATPTTSKNGNWRLGLSPNSEGSAEKVTINVNNVDLIGEVFPDEIASADEHESEIINHFFGSAKNGQQVREAFTNLLYASCMAAYSKRKSAEKKSASSGRPPDSSQRGIVDIGGSHTTRSSWGCSFKYC